MSEQMVKDWLSFMNMQFQAENDIEKKLQEQHQLSLKEFSVLFYLNEAPNKKLKLLELQHQVGLSQSAMSRLVSRFEGKKCGVLNRHICVEDKRAIYIILTEEGERKLTKALQTISLIIEEFYSKVDINEYYHKLIGHLNK